MWQALSKKRLELNYTTRLLESILPRSVFLALGIKSHKGKAKIKSIGVCVCGCVRTVKCVAFMCLALVYMGLSVGVKILIHLWTLQSFPFKQLPISDTALKRALVCCVCVNWHARRMRKQVPRGVGYAKPRPRQELQWGPLCSQLLGRGWRIVCACVCVCAHSVFILQSCYPWTAFTNPTAGMQGTRATHSHDTCCLFICLQSAVPHYQPPPTPHRDEGSAAQCPAHSFNRFQTLPGGFTKSIVNQLLQIFFSIEFVNWNIRQIFYHQREKGHTGELYS